MKDLRLTLASMPWYMPTSPSIQTGVLAAFVRSRNAADVSVLPLHVDWYEFMRERCDLDVQEALDLYLYVTQNLYQVIAGEWVFAGCLTPGFREQEYLDFLAARGVSPRRLETLHEFRHAAPDFVEAAARQVLEAEPDVLGLTSTFCQTMPSLALAKRVKQLAPNTRVLLGGSNCDGTMGPALLRSYDFVDGVVSGEGERPLLHALDSVRRGGTLTPTPGLLPRGSEPAGGPQFVPLDGISVTPTTPDYDEYFARVRSSRDRDFLLQACELPIEMSRGCWWGEKHHCTFCGLNGTGMKFRSKGSAALGAQLEELASRHGVLDFYAVDNILDMQHLREAMPQVAALDRDFSLFFEVKANLRRDQLGSMRAAGVTAVQPGIESLSTPILKGIDKGVTAFQNVRFLLDCTEIGIKPDWNIILGLPAETPERLREIIELIPSLTHLQPPNVSMLTVERFSPYFDRAEDYGIRLLGPRDAYRYVFDLADQDLADVAYMFKFGLVADHQDNAGLRKQLCTRVDIWRKTWQSSSLTCRRGPRMLVIDDDRAGLPGRRLVLRDAEGEIFGACLGGTSVAKLHALGASLDCPAEKVDALLATWRGERLTFQEGSSVIALPVSADR